MGAGKHEGGASRIFWLAHPRVGGQELGRDGTGRRSIARTGIGERPDGSQMEQGGGSEQTVRLRAGMLV